MLVDRAKHCGWQQPTEEQHADRVGRCKALRFATVVLPPAAPTSNNSALCCDLDQGPLGSCTANAWAQVCYMILILLGLPAFIASRLANYFWNRNSEGNAEKDVGASVGGAFEVGAGMGVAEEAVWPYLTERFAMMPPPEVARNAFDRKGKIRVNYHPIDAIGEALIEMIERVLTSGRGVAFGIHVTEKFCATLPDGVVQFPGYGERIAGGHALTIVGHNRAERWFLVRNSWGADWREPGLPPGCCRLAYDYVKRGSDFWFVALSTGGL